MRICAMFYNLNNDSNINNPIYYTVCVHCIQQGDADWLLDQTFHYVTCPKTFGRFMGEYFMDVAQFLECVVVGKVFQCLGLDLKLFLLCFIDFLELF